jgi:hypothetical protein
LDNCEASQRAGQLDADNIAMGRCYGEQTGGLTQAQVCGGKLHKVGRNGQCTDNEGYQSQCTDKVGLPKAGQCSNMSVGQVDQSTVLHNAAATAASGADGLAHCGASKGGGCPAGTLLQENTGCEITLFNTPVVDDAPVAFATLAVDPSHALLCSTSTPGASEIAVATAIATSTPLDPVCFDAGTERHTLSSSSSLHASELGAPGRLDSAAQQQQQQQLAGLHDGQAAADLEPHSVQPSNGQQQQQQQQRQQQQGSVGSYREWRVAGMLQANCALVPVLDAGACQLHLAVVATADIAAGEELMLDYGPDYWDAKLGEWNEWEMATQLQQVSLKQAWTCTETLDCSMQS